MDNALEDSASTNIEPISITSKSTKETKKHANNLPKSAFALYIRLYCSQKTTKSLKHTSRMIEATKSWLTLSDFEKQKFYDKYKEYQEKYSDAFISCLKKSEPFMKKKATARVQKRNLNDLPKEDPTLEDEKIELDEPSSADLENDSNNGVVEQKTEIFDNHDNIEMEQLENPWSNKEDNTLQDPSKIMYLEPTAPNLKSGKELFEIIQSNAENDLTWALLPQRERSLYNRAVLAMKKDYIHKYKIYLESLTQKQLFDHYNKCFKS